MVIGTKLKAQRLISAALLFLGSIPMMGDPQFGAAITIASAGTAVPLVANKATVPPVLVNSIFIQAPHCTTCGIIYVLNCNPQVTCVNGSAGTTLVAEIPAGTATSPGGWFRFPTNGSSTTNSGGTDLRYWAVDSATSGVVALTSWDMKQ